VRSLGMVSLSRKTICIVKVLSNCEGLDVKYKELCVDTRTPIKS